MRMVITVDDYDLERALRVVAEFGSERYGYVVTPNVDHIIRHCHDGRFRSMYSEASYVLLDSRFLANTLGFLRRQALPVCIGSDLTGALLSSVTKPTDVLALVGGSAEQADLLRARYGLRALHHIDPPMGFIRDPEKVAACLEAIEAIGPFRFCFLAIGSPQQEIVAQRLKERGMARGLALCVGASINFLTGIERRAPAWMRNAGLEWAYRLAQNPRRLAGRYLVRGPRIFYLLPRIKLCVRRSTAATNLISSPGTPLSAAKG